MSEARDGRDWFYSIGRCKDEGVTRLPLFSGIGRRREETTYGSQ